MKHDSHSADSTPADARHDASIQSSPAADARFIEKLTEIVDRMMSEPSFSVNLLAKEAAVSRTVLFMRVKEILGKTPNDFILALKLEKAERMLSDNNVRVDDVCWQVGFSSRSHFAKCFKTRYGVAPSEYRTGKRKP